jgi:hypothetical protein
MFSYFFPKNHAVNEIVRKKYFTAGQATVTIWRMRLASWMLNSTNSLRIYNTYCFYASTMVAQARPSGTLYVHCLSCYQCYREKIYEIRRRQSVNEAVNINMSVCLYSCCSYLAFRPHYFMRSIICHVWPVWLYCIFPHCLINCTIFWKKKNIEHKIVFWFYLQLLSETFLILRTEWDIIINVVRNWSKLPVILADFNELEFSRQIFEKHLYQTSW